MKKMIVFAFMAMVTGLVQASSVNWQITGNTFGPFIDDPRHSSNGGNGRAVGYDVLVFYATDMAAIDTALATSDFGTLSSLAITGGKTSATGAVGGMWSGETLTTFDIFAVAFNTYGSGQTLTDATWYLKSANLTVTSYDPPSPAVPGNWTSSNWGNTPWTEMVPEPTAMALVALGVAAVGLRRRFRK